MKTPSIAYLLELRLSMRGNPEGKALVDRCLSLVARAEGADDATFAALQGEVRQIGDELALRFGTPSSVVLQ